MTSPTTERVRNIVDMMYECGLYTQAAEIERAFADMAEAHRAALELAGANRVLCPCCNPLSAAQPATEKRIPGTEFEHAGPDAPIPDAAPRTLEEVPQLPWPDKTIYGPNRTVDGHYFSAAKMREYGKACHEAAFRSQSAETCSDAKEQNEGCFRAVKAERLVKSAEALLREAREKLARYRNETPLGHQPHMIALDTERLIARIDAHLKEWP